MEVLLFFAFIAFLVFPALLKGQKAKPSTSNKAKSQNSGVPATRNLNPNTRGGNSFGGNNFQAQKPVKGSTYTNQNPRVTKQTSTSNKAQLQDLASRLQQRQTFETFKVAPPKVKVPELKQVIKRVKTRGEILDLNKSRRADWGQRQKGDVINGKSVLAVSGALLILLYITSRLT